MKLGLIGLGKMGANMARRLLQANHHVVGFDLNEEALATLEEDGGTPVRSDEELARALERPRIFWLMIPAGEAIDRSIEALRPHLDAGDIIVDGGNSNYKDTVRRAITLREDGVFFVDVGTSGGIWGLTEGYSLMIGGDDEAVDRLRPALETLAPDPERGWGHVGPPGAGHFVKMIHNGIEYGMMQAYAEGFAILREKKEFGFDLRQIADIWRHGSVIRSWLLDLTSEALGENPDLAEIVPYVPDSGEGRWTVKEAIDLDVPAPVITLSLVQRLQSRTENSYAFRLLAALRNQFGGHAVRRLEQIDE